MGVCFKKLGQQEEWKFKRKSQVNCEALTARIATELFLNLVKGEIGICLCFSKRLNDDSVNSVG